MKSFRYLMAVSLTGLLVSACGSGSDLGANYSSANLSSALNTSQGSGQDAELADAIPKILKGLQDIKEEIHALDGRYTGGAAPLAQSALPADPGALANPAALTNPATPSAGSATPAAPAASPAKPAGPTPQERGAIELKALLNAINTTPFVQLIAEKVEKNLDTGKISTNKIKMWSKQPNVVKVDILESTSGSAGVQALYTSGSGDKVQVKKLFIKLDLAKTDDRVASNNGFLADQIDLFGVSKRLAQPAYSAELIGTTKMGGQTVNILKITSAGTNSLEPRIAYEYLGYEPGSYKVRLWEAYDNSGSKQPFYRMSIPEIAYPASIPDSEFKL